MKPCYKEQCLNHDKDKPFNCWSYATVEFDGGRCSEYINAQGSMRTFNPGCHKEQRRYVSNRGEVVK